MTELFTQTKNEIKVDCLKNVHSTAFRKRGKKIELNVCTYYNNSI